MKIISEKETGMGGKWVLVKYEDNYYAYGCETDLHSFLGFPVEQCGTKEKVLSHCNSIAKLCKTNIGKYQKEYSRDRDNGWKILIEQNKKQYEMLIEFSRILSNIK